MKQAPQSPPSRKNFLLLAIAAFFSAVFARLLVSRKKKPAETVKMLTQEGYLVEIDKSIIAARHTKISDRDLQQWVKQPFKKQNQSL